MTSAEEDIKDAIRNGTLDDNASVAELPRRQHNLETNTEEDSQPHEESQEGEEDDGEEAAESRKLLDYDDSDEFTEEDYESESDYGKPHKGKCKRGRPKTKPTEEARAAAALETRRKRMRLNHGTPDSNEKNPKRHLFGPIAELRDLSETASPTPSKPAMAKNHMKKVNAATSSPSPVSRRMTRRKSAIQAESTPSKQPVRTPPSLHDSVSPAARPSLMVKLKARRSFVPTPAPKSRPGRPSKKDKGSYKSAVVVKSDEEIMEEVSIETLGVGMRGKRKATRKRAIIKDDDAGEEKAVGQKTRDVKTHEQGREARSTTRVTRQRRGGLTATGAGMGTGKPPSSTLKIKQHAATRQWRRAVPATEAHNDAPASPQPKQNTTTRRRRGAISSPVKLPNPSPLSVPTSTSQNNPSDKWSDEPVISETSSPPIHTLPNPPNPLSNPLPSSPNTNTPVSKPLTPLQPSSASAFAPYPPMSPRSLSPFTRGARIALENILADHQSDPLISLLDLVEELDDTRPIVNDWEHVTVMKGGSWVYQVMRDVWEDAVQDEDEDEDETMDEDVDIEDVVEKVGGWVDREVGRLGGSGRE